MAALLVKANSRVNVVHMAAMAWAEGTASRRLTSNERMVEAMVGRRFSSLSAMPYLPTARFITSTLIWAISGTTPGSFVLT